jgi:hypothetical protein
MLLITQQVIISSEGEGKSWPGARSARKTKNLDCKGVQKEFKLLILLSSVAVWTPSACRRVNSRVSEDTVKEAGPPPTHTPISLKKRRAKLASRANSGQMGGALPLRYLLQCDIFSDNLFVLYFE